MTRQGSAQAVGQVAGGPFGRGLPTTGHATGPRTGQRTGLAAGLLALGLLAGCGGDNGVSPLFDRAIVWGPERSSLDLAVGQSADVPVRICPAVRAYQVAFAWESAVSFQPGAYELAVENLPPDVSATFLDGGRRWVPGPNSAELGAPLGAQAGLPWAGAPSDQRYCWQHTLRLTRGTVAGALPARPVQVTLRIRYEDVVYVTLAADETRREPLTLRLVDAAAGAPPVTGAACAADAAVAGRWIDAFAAPPALDGASGELDATLVQDRPLLGRVARPGNPAAGSDLVADEWVGDSWRRTRLTTPAAADQVRVTAWRDPATGAPRRLAAWRSVDYTAPRDEQARVRAAWIGESGTWAPLPADAGMGFESEVRGLQLAAWQGQPVVGWLRPTGLVLQRFDGSAWQAIASPVDAAYDGTTRQLRLRVDPVDDALVLAFAGVDRDGVTRLRAWRLAGASGSWSALPVLEAGAPQGLGAGLAAFALDALGGSTTLAWSYGQVSFSSTSQLTMSVQRLERNAGAWAPLGNAATLSDRAAGYGVQPVTMALAPSCSGGAYLAWHEPGNYPEGRIAGAQWAAAPGWDPFGRADLATLASGRGTYAADLRLLTAADGRPLLVAVLQPATGGPAQVVLRRYAP